LPWDLSPPSYPTPLALYPDSTSQLGLPQHPDGKSPYARERCSRRTASLLTRAAEAPDRSGRTLALLGQSGFPQSRRPLPQRNQCFRERNYPPRRLAAARDSPPTTLTASASLCQAYRVAPGPLTKRLAPGTTHLGSGTGFAPPSASNNTGGWAGKNRGAPCHKPRVLSERRIWK